MNERREKRVLYTFQVSPRLEGTPPLGDSQLPDRQGRSSRGWLTIVTLLIIMLGLFFINKDVLPRILLLFDGADEDLFDANPPQETNNSQGENKFGAGYSITGEPTTIIVSSSQPRSVNEPVDNPPATITFIGPPDGEEPQEENCKRNIRVFTDNPAPIDGTLEFRTLWGNETTREASLLVKTWQIAAGQQINNDIASKANAPGYARLWWKPADKNIWYLLPSQYWSGDGSTASEFSIACQPTPLPSYDTSFSIAIPENQVCFDLLEGCN